jgi:hypothetical protein
MVEWDFLIQELKADRPLNIPGWEPISVTYGVGGFGGDRFFVLLRRAR